MATGLFAKGGCDTFALAGGILTHSREADVRRRQSQQEKAKKAKIDAASPEPTSSDPGDESIPKDGSYRKSMFDAGGIKGHVQYSGPAAKTMYPGNHWTENPNAFAMMQGMSFQYAVPKLQPRLTKFHGTHIPVKLVFFLSSVEVGRLASLDTFFKRIVQHPMLWQGIYCRDYDRYGCKRCVWRTLEGRAGSEKCLFHLAGTHPPEFHAICKKITAIPGRLPEELLETYRIWRTEQKALLDLLEAHSPKGGKKRETLLDDVGYSTGRDLGLTGRVASVCEAPPAAKPGIRRPRAVSGLGSNHRVPAHRNTKQIAQPVLVAPPTSTWVRRPAGLTPRLPALKA